MVEYRLKRNGTNYTWSFSSGVVPPLFIRGSGAQTGEILKFITSLKIFMDVACNTEQGMYMLMNL